MQNMLQYIFHNQLKAVHYSEERHSRTVSSKCLMKQYWTLSLFKTASNKTLIYLGQ